MSELWRSRNLTGNLPFHLQTRLLELHRQWDLLLEKMREKGVKLLQAQKLVQYLRECEDVMDWINDKVRWGRKACRPLPGTGRRRREPQWRASAAHGWQSGIALLPASSVLLADLKSLM